MPVLGIGGLFFRARDPDALNAWYRQHLNIGAGCASDPTETSSEWYWQAQGGLTVFAPFKADTDYFAADKQWMLNLRVSDIDALIAGLTAAGIEVVTKPDWDDPQTGRFARIHDPEGNAIELWQPPA
ncbi:VOC family protein [Sphingomonas sp.]|jgi:predicted enzyme related to lactoylglutathione lyase|uniref:VOC family protein n=1 Tax=Sphingomonas sp. TaxID=28214 RepID=UPI002D7F3D8B|nr:VOC family protein [Sphingomonas sp.]HEU0045726.1 VOC family protein [Sphingomonas sp.]